MLKAEVRGGEGRVCRGEGGVEVGWRVEEA